MKMLIPLNVGNYKLFDYTNKQIVCTGGIYEAHDLQSDTLNMIEVFIKRYSEVYLISET
jgi:hypothetical protein